MEYRWIVPMIHRFQNELLWKCSRKNSKNPIGYFPAISGIDGMIILPSWNDDKIILDIFLKGCKIEFFHLWEIIDLNDFLQLSLDFLNETERLIIIFLRKNYVIH